ncbi:MAG: hypothetical protein IJD48_01800 [Clostridia bacterium]|nr:hypothetical protein [Clostridia bacterium]
MTSKRKFTIAGLAFFLVFVFAVGSLALIMAALNATVSSGIVISYSAKNIDAAVSISYKITDQDPVTMYVDEQRTESVIEFYPDEESGVTKSFQPTGNIEIGPTDKIVFTMIVTNRSSVNDLYLDTSMLNGGFSTLTNMSVESGLSHYSLFDPETEELLVGEDVEGFIPNSGGVYTIEPTKTLYCYLRFYVRNDIEDARVEAEFPFYLSSNINDFV